MQASKEWGAPVVPDTGREKGGAVARKDLDDSWFRWQKPPTLPPPRPRLESLDDEIADAWFV
jgi:hypothetical protein